MHAEVLDVALLRLFLPLGSQPQKPFFVDEHSQRLHAGDQHLDPHVELESVDQLGLVQVALHHARVGRRELHVAGQEDAFPLGSCLRLNDHGDFASTLLV